MMPRISPINSKVRRAFFHSGRLKAKTPSEIASTPVSAVHPAEKALSTKNKPRDSLTGKLSG